MNQPTLFENVAPTVEMEKLTLYALGEFQARGKVLAGRELALDRLRGAFRRASDVFSTEEPADEKIAEALERLGAKVVRRPSFMAKHPFRVTISADLAVRALGFYEQTVVQKAEVSL